jgi:hypothetical protein
LRNAGLIRAAVKAQGTRPQRGDPGGAGWRRFAGAIPCLVIARALQIARTAPETGAERAI